jgi:GNAT superfamily N-acetyltransferase
VETAVVEIELAARDDLADLARLLWLHAAPDEQGRQTVASFASDLGEWWSANDRSHVAFVARRGAAGVVGMAWLALVPRVPRPGTTGRCSGDIQSVFVLPEERGKGLGAGLIAAASTYALGLGAGRVVVQSGRRAVPLYERLGFASSPQLLQTPAE